nr:LptF/LptG family permease [uncultured Treponema sp.]
MKLVWYVFKMFLPLLFGMLFLFIFGFEIGDLFMNIWKYIFNNVPVKEVLHIMLLYIPKTITYALPLSILFGICYMLCSLASQNELVAFFASGVSYIRFVLPLIIFALILSHAYMVFEDKVVVPTYKQYTDLKNELLHIEQNKNSTNITIRSENGKIIYKADTYESSSKRLHGLLVIVRNDEAVITDIIKAAYAVWSEDRAVWVLSSPVVYSLNEEGELSSGYMRPQLEELLIESPDTFKNNEVDVETVTIAQAKEYLRYLQRTGLPGGKAYSVYYKKFSFPYVILIVTFLAIGLTGRSRRNIFIISMFISLSASVVFYVLQMVTMLLAENGYIVPAAGAWLPVIIFLIISVLLLKNSKT